MAGIVVTSVWKSGAGCDHRRVTVSLDGESIEVHTGEAELDAMPWTAEEKRQLVLLELKRRRVGGLVFDSAVGRVYVGDEGNNLKQFLLLGKDVTKTNIGTSYVNIPVGANGERSLVEFAGCTQFRIVMNANHIGTGPWQYRVIRDSDNAVFYESPTISQTGERELDTDWQNIPGGFSGTEIVRLQGKSAVASDDPVIRRCVMLVR